MRGLVLQFKEQQAMELVIAVSKSVQRFRFVREK